jgi:transcriptional regulator with XRE-family HTH domain
MKIGDNIKNLRELKNLTQAYMAERLNMSISGYSKIEKNKTDVALSKILTIAEILETDISTLLNFDAKQVVYQTNNHSVVAGGHNNTQNINGNIENILTNIQEDIQKLKSELNK